MSEALFYAIIAFLVIAFTFIWRWSNYHLERSSNMEGPEVLTIKPSMTAPHTDVPGGGDEPQSPAPAEEKELDFEEDADLGDDDLGEDEDEDEDSLDEDDED